MGRKAADRPPFEQDASRARFEMACDHVEQRGLPCAIGADDRPALVRGHAERHAGECRERPGMQSELLDREQQLGPRYARMPIRPRNAPTIPPGAKSTNTMKVSPRISIHRSV